MPLLFPSASPYLSPEEVWTTAFNELSQRIRRYFVRPEPHQRALSYAQGLMSSVERKNGWQVAEEMGEASPYAMQHLLDRAKWDCDGVRDTLRVSIWETLAAPTPCWSSMRQGFSRKGANQWAFNYSTVARLVASKTVRRECFFPTPVRVDTRGFTENCIYPRVGQQSKIKKILSERLRQK